MVRHSDIALSVIIPVYNSEEWLTRCLDSVLAQVVPVSWELILIDDGSSDNSGRICDDYARSFTVIRVVHTANQGASLARRLGLEIAWGEYVSFVDSDDYVKPGYLSTLYELIKVSGCSISACAVEGGMTPSASGTPQILSFDELMPRFFKYEFWGLYAKCYRRDLLVGIEFPSATICEDYYVSARLFQKERAMAFVSVALYVYDHHPKSLSRTPVSAKAFGEFENVRGVYDFVLDKMPEYRSYALSNAVESAVKLLVASRKQAPAYSQQRKELKRFLAKNRSEILSCKPLHRKVAFLALLLEKV